MYLDILYKRRMEGFVFYQKRFQYFRSLLRIVLLDELIVKLVFLLCWFFGCLYMNRQIWGEGVRVWIVFCFFLVKCVVGQYVCIYLIVMFLLSRVLRGVECQFWNLGSLYFLDYNYILFFRRVRGKIFLELVNCIILGY